MHTEHTYVRAHNTHKTAKSGYAYPVCLLSGALGHLCTTQVNFSNKFSWKQGCYYTRAIFLCFTSPSTWIIISTPPAEVEEAPKILGPNMLLRHIYLYGERLWKLDGSAAILAQPSLTHHETQNNFARFCLHSWVDWSNDYEQRILLKDATITIAVNQ